MSDSTWTISRVASETELREAWAILGQAYEPPMWKRMSDYDAYVAKVAKHATTLLISSENRIAGGISFYANDTASGKGFITQVMVSSLFQGQGLGTRLLKQCEVECKAHGMKALGLEVRRDNLRAKKLYEHIGFKICGETKGGWLMEKPLF